MADERLTWLRVPDEGDLPAEVKALYDPPREKLGFVPNVLRLYALRPLHLLRWNDHYEELMKGDSGLSKAEREMIAVVVSVANECRYCIGAHSAALRKLTKDTALKGVSGPLYWTPRSPTPSRPTTARLRSRRASWRCSTTRGS